MTHPFGDNTILTDERQTDQRNSRHLREVRAGALNNHHRLSATHRFGLAVGVVAAAIGLGIALPNSSDDGTVPLSPLVPANVR